MAASVKTQFPCCLCGQVNVFDLNPATALPLIRRGVFARLLDWLYTRRRFKPSRAAPARYTVSCQFCRQNNVISMAHKPPRSSTRE